MKLYHYTCLEWLHLILQDKEIKLTRGNLVPPINPRIVNGKLVDPTDSFKPVVWLTSLLDFSRAGETGITGGLLDKTEAAIEIDTAGPQMFYKWNEWAIANGIDGAWFEGLKKTAPQWKYFYVTESPVKITDNTRVIFRPDIMRQMEHGETVKGFATKPNQ